MFESSLAFAEASRLLGEDPLPPDAEERLQALEKKIRLDELDRFGDLWGRSMPPQFSYPA